MQYSAKRTKYEEGLRDTEDRVRSSNTFLIGVLERKKDSVSVCQKSFQKIKRTTDSQIWKVQKKF